MAALLLFTPIFAKSNSDFAIFKTRRKTPVFDLIDTKHKLLTLPAGTLLRVFHTDSKGKGKSPYADTNLGKVLKKELVDVSQNFEVVSFSEPPDHCAVNVEQKLYSCYNDSKADTSPVPIVTRIMLTGVKYFLIMSTTCEHRSPALLYAEDLKVLPNYESGIAHRTLMFFVRRGTKDAALFVYNVDPWECG